MELSQQQMKTDILTNMANNVQSIFETVDELRETIRVKEKEIYDLRAELAQLQQYNRRNNIEIAGIPNNIKDESLEKKVIELCKDLGVVVEDRDIEAVHRLPSNRDSNLPKRTIVRFVNRKNCERLLRKRKSLKSHNFRKIGLHQNRIYINENLCPYFYRIWKKTRLLHKHNMIMRFWTFNGIPHIKMTADSDPIQIYNEYLLHEVFPDFDFENPPEIQNPDQ